MRLTALRIATLAPALALLSGALVTTSADAQVSSRVRSACAGDYQRYCPAYEVGSTRLKSCMRAVGKRLTPACVDALVASGELPRKQAKRR